MERFKNIALAVLVIAVCCLGYLYFHKEHTPEVVNVPQVTPQEVQKAIPEASHKEAERTTRIIERTVTKEVPVRHWYASSEPAADARTQKIAKVDKADKVIKTVEEKPIEGSDKKIVEADYYGIHLERKHRVKAGAAVIDGNTYISLGYQNRDIEYKAYYSPEKKDFGAGIEVTIAKW